MTSRACCRARPAERRAGAAPHRRVGPGGPPRGGRRRRRDLRRLHRRGAGRPGAGVRCLREHQRRRRRAHRPLPPVAVRPRRLARRGPATLAIRTCSSASKAGYRIQGWNRSSCRWPTTGPSALVPTGSSWTHPCSSAGGTSSPSSAEAQGGPSQARSWALSVGGLVAGVDDAEAVALGVGEHHEVGVSVGTDASRPASARSTRAGRPRRTGRRHRRRRGRGGRGPAPVTRSCPTPDGRHHRGPALRTA